MIVTIALTRDEGHVVGLGGLQRVRKIFAGCPAIPSLRGQSPVHISSRSVHRSRSVGNRPVYYYGQPNLCRPAAEAQIQDRSRKKTWLNTAQAFSRVSDNISSPSKGQGQGERRRSPLPRWERARVRVKEARSAATVGDARGTRRSCGGGNPEKNKARRSPISSIHPCEFPQPTITPPSI